MVQDENGSDRLPRDRSRVGLARHAAALDLRSCTLVAAAIAALQASNTPVSLTTLTAETGKFDPDGRCLAASTILRNPTCNAAYRAARPPLRRSRRKHRPLPRSLQHTTRVELAEALLTTRAKLRECKACLKALTQEVDDLRDR